MNSKRKNKKILRKFIRRNKIYLSGANFMRKTVTDKGTKVIQFEKDGNLLAEILDPDNYKILINY